MSDGEPAAGSAANPQLSVSGGDPVAQALAGANHAGEVGSLTALLRERTPVPVLGGV